MTWWKLDICLPWNIHKKHISVNHSLQLPETMVKNPIVHCGTTIEENQILGEKAKNANGVVLFGMMSLLRSIKTLIVSFDSVMTGSG